MLCRGVEFSWQFGTGCNGRSGVINNTPAVNHVAECKALDAQIANYDAMARQPQSGQMQDWITAEKKNARDQQFRIKC